MNVIRRSLSGLTLNEYNEKHLCIVNQFLPIQITKTEIKVLAGFMSLQGDVSNYNRFGTEARKIIMGKLTMSSGGLGNHLKSLKNKAFIFYDDKKVLQINPHLIPADVSQGYQFKISKI
jgi:hypothetical protein